MAGEKYELYGRPIPPTDPNADVMTVQESAYVLKCGVSYLRRWLKSHSKFRAYSGRRLVMNRAARDAYYRAHQGAKQPARTAA